MKNTLLTLLLLCGLLTCITFISCNPDDTGPEECDFDVNSWCRGGGVSFSIVNKDTYENLVGVGKLIDPDKIVVTNTRTDTMYIDPLLFSDGWVSIEGFSPFEEITCFNQCLLDSAFTRTYYLNYGGIDTDTMEIFFPARSDEPVITFNKTTGDVPNDIADSLGRGRSLYWFLKEIN